MTDNLHDRIVNFIARTRFPFAGQTTWPADYVTLTNVPRRQRAIASAKGEHFPDIVILDGTGRVREIGDVVMHLRAGSDSADADTPSGVRHFFLYVPSGMEQAAQRLLDENAISY